MSAPNTDPTLWTARPVFGVAGGPVEIVLTDEGNQRAFSVGSKVRRGGPAEALEALWAAQGHGHLSVRTGLGLTKLGLFDQVAWGHLRAKGYVESFQDEHGDGVRLTEAGKQAAWAGIEERKYLLDRCRLAGAGAWAGAGAGAWAWARAGAGAWAWAWAGAGAGAGAGRVDEKP